MITPNQPKQWWAPVWTGLAIDPEGQHYRRMKNAVWLYLYFLLHANRRTGVLVRKLQTISEDMGLPRDTILRWLNVLRQQAYVTSVGSGRALTIQVTRWKPIVRAGETPRQRSETVSSRSGISATAGIPGDRTFPEQTGRTRSDIGGSNKRDNKEKKLNNMHLTLHDDQFGANLAASLPPVPQELLAQELAAVLEDSRHINRYRAYCWRYPEWLLRKLLLEAQQATTAGNQGRAAIFTNLLHRYVTGTTPHLGH